MTDDTSDQNPEQSQPPKDQLEDKFLVVGLGASAGGIQALKEFFNHVPKDSGMAYVVILHMSPEYESRLAEILQVSTPIPVTQVKQRVKIEPNHVYVIPPNRNLGMQDGHLDLSEITQQKERRSPIDTFLRTLADSNKERGVSVILSGTGADGSMGMKRIKEHGGVVFVQDPEEAEYSDMPRNAIATGMVDHVLPIAEIPAKIISYKEHLGSVQIPQASAEEVPQTEEQAVLDIFTELRVRTGYDFSNYKPGTVLRRIERRLGLRELRGLQAYTRYLADNSHEVDLLMKDLLISVTNFFRDPESFEALANKVVPKIFERKKPDDSIRVWVAGCSTGEEAYSIAMLFAEQMPIGVRSPTLQIFATDLDQEAISIAREGFFKDAEVADVSTERLRRFFVREVKGYRIKRELRESVLFAVHNVIKDPPFSHLDLISCRNLLMYFNRKVQDRVLEVFHFALNPGGHLFMGTSESIGGTRDLFTSIDKEHRIYGTRPMSPRSLPIPQTTFRSPLTPIGEIEESPEETRTMKRMSYADLHQRLLESYAPPSVIVNEDYDIVHLSDRAGRYMQIPGGDPSHNLLRVVRPELQLELRTALNQAVNDRVNVEVRGLKLPYETGLKIVNLLVRPVLREEDASRSFILVLFEEEKEDQQSQAREVVIGPSEPIDRRLVEELEHSKAQLRATVEQYEIQQEELRASNEELQAMNEELHSAAEELETSKEELQSLNEELTTVNQELKIKIEELTLASNNFINLINSTNIGTIFLDRSFRIRQFTPRATDAFNLISRDIGRPLMDITGKFKGEDIQADMERVLDSLQNIEREVKTPDGHAYMMRLSPYRTLDEKIDGVVITIVDVTERSRVREELRRAGELLEVRVAGRTRELATANEALRSEVAQRKHSEDSRMKLLEQIVTAQEDERGRIARDLHDQFGQRLTALGFKLEALKTTNENRQHVNTTVDELQHIVKQLDSDVDFLAWQLRPAVLDDLGLSVALSNYVRQWSEHFGIAAEFRAGDLKDNQLDSRLTSNLYRIAQEALNNCGKHSKCSKANVLLERRGDHAVLIVEDNGIGFDPQAKRESNGQWGLIGMRERSALLGGTVEIESGPNKGTTIFVRIPLTGGQAFQE